MYETYNLETYPLYVIPTTRFKRNTIRLIFHKRVKKKDISYLLFLFEVLFEGSKKYPEGRKLRIASDDLYSLGWNSNVSIAGNLLSCTIQMNFLDETYTEKGMMEKSISFFHDLLFEPNVENGSFLEETVEIVRKRMLEMLETEKENPSAHAMESMLKILSPDTPISYSSIGYKEDYLEINGKNLYEFYLEFLNTYSLDIYVCGHTKGIDWESNIRNLIPKNIGCKKESFDIFITHDRYYKRVRKVVEKEKNNQSKLVLGFKMEPLTLFEKQYVLHIYNYILGGGVDSFLFQEVREKNSLCYSITSSFSISNGIFTIRAGIDARNLNQTVRLIRKQLKKMEEGKFKEKSMENAKLIYKEAKEELTDSVNGLINNLGNHVGFGFDLYEVQMKEIEKVKKEDVMNLAQKIHIDTIYLLEGVNEHEGY